MTDWAKEIRTQVMAEMRGDLGSPAKLRRLLGPQLQKASETGTAEERKAQVSAVVRGTMEGFLLIGKDMAGAAVLTMQAVCEAADTLGLDTQQTMRWGLVGVAQAGRVAPPGTLPNMRAALNDAFLGVGEAFDTVCRELALAR